MLLYNKLDLKFVDFVFTNKMYFLGSENIQTDNSSF